MDALTGPAWEEAIARAVPPAVPAVLVVPTRQGSGSFHTPIMRRAAAHGVKPDFLAPLADALAPLA